MSGTKSIDKALGALKRILIAESEQRVNDIAAELDLPLSTIYRHLASLERHGLLRRKYKSVFTPGVFLLEIFDPESFRRLLIEASRPVTEELANQLKMTSHLGVFENDMVTYLIKSESENYGFFTRESTQLDAYCSGLGKVLLSGLTNKNLDTYFSDGNLPALTKNTITDESDLRKEISKIRAQGYAVDNEEFEDGLYCIATPIADRDGRVLAALSVSSKSSPLISTLTTVPRILKAAANKITRSLYTR